MSKPNGQDDAYESTAAADGLTGVITRAGAITNAVTGDKQPRCAKYVPPYLARPMLEPALYGGTGGTWVPGYSGLKAPPLSELGAGASPVDRRDGGRLDDFQKASMHGPLRVSPRDELAVTLTGQQGQATDCFCCDRSAGRDFAGAGSWESPSSDPRSRTCVRVARETRRHSRHVSCSLILPSRALLSSAEAINLSAAWAGMTRHHDTCYGVTEGEAAPTCKIPPRWRLNSRTSN